MRKVIVLFMLLIFTFTVNVGVVTVYALDESENKTIEVLEKQLKGAQFLKEKSSPKYSETAELDLELKLFLQYISLGKQQAAKGYLNSATELVQNSPELSAKIGDNMNELNSSFNVWVSSPTSTVTEGIQRSVANIIEIAKADVDKITGLGIAKVIINSCLVILIVVLVLLKIFKR